MKKFFFIYMALLSLLLLSCGNIGDVTETTVPPDETTVPPVSDLPPSDVVDIKLMPHNTLLSSQLTPFYQSFFNVGYIDENTELPEKLSVFKGKYMSHMTGPLYEFDEELEARLNANMEKMLGLLYSDYALDAAGYTIETESLPRLVYTNGDVSVASNATFVGINISGASLPEDITDEELLSNTYVKAALEYLGIKDPAVTLNIEYNIEGEEYNYNYEIYERTDDAVKTTVNKCFSCIKVQHIASAQGRYGYFVHVVDTGEDDRIPMEEYPVISFSDAVDALVTLYPDIDRESIMAEMYYNSYKIPTFYLPTYRFYVKESESVEESRYKYVDVLAVDMPDEALEWDPEEYFGNK